MRKIFITLGLGSLLFTTTLLAQEQFGTKIFNKCDDNKDGFLDKKEYLNMSTKRFNRMDKNKDTMVTFTELSTTFLAKMMPMVATSWFERNDTNKDTIVTFKEMEQVSDKKFSIMDNNNDTKLSGYEFLKSSYSLGIK